MHRRLPAPPRVGVGRIVRGRRESTWVDAVQYTKSVVGPARVRLWKASRTLRPLHHVDDGEADPRIEANATSTSRRLSRCRFS